MKSAARYRSSSDRLHVYDPVAEGYVAKLSHPGGNLTGLVSFLAVVEKRLELFTTIVPSPHRVLVLVNPEDPMTPRELDETPRAAATLQLTLVEREMSRPEQAQDERRHRRAPRRRRRRLQPDQANPGKTIIRVRP